MLSIVHSVIDNSLYIFVIFTFLDYFLGRLFLSTIDAAIEISLALDKIHIDSKRYILIIFDVIDSIAVIEYKNLGSCFSFRLALCFKLLILYYYR